MSEPRVEKRNARADAAHATAVEERHGTTSGPTSLVLDEAIAIPRVRG